MFSSSVIIPVIRSSNVYTSKICVIPHLQSAVTVLTPISVVIMSGFNNVITNSISKITKFFSYEEVDHIEVTAPYDCSVEITHTFLGWGYAGGLFVFGINSSSSGITKKCENFGGCQGGDTVNKYLRADAVYTGLKKGQKYTFSRQEITGGNGAKNNRKWTVICHPE